MSQYMPITRRRIRNHFQYHFWKYLLLIVIAGFGWNLLYTTTRYRSPENAKVEFIAEGNVTASDATQALADRIHAEIMQDMEEVTATVVTFDQTYGDMQLVVWVSAGQGDVYLLSRERFLSMATNDSMLDLTPFVQNGALHTEGIDITDGYTTSDSTGKQTLTGIPADRLVKLSQAGLDPQGKVLCILYNNGNDANSVKFLDYLLTRMQAEDAAATDTAATDTAATDTAATDTAATDTAATDTAATDTAAPDMADATVQPSATLTPNP